MNSTATIRETSNLTILNELSEVPKMALWLRNELEALNAPPEVLFKFDLSANEAVINIISYAFSNTPKSDHKCEIVLKLLSDKENAYLEIFDSGKPFNPLENPEPLQPTNIEDAEIGGLGIKLIRNFIDKCEYTRINNQNILRLSNSLSSPSL